MVPAFWMSVIGSGALPDFAGDSYTVQDGVCDAARNGDFLSNISLNELRDALSRPAENDDTVDERDN